MALKGYVPKPGQLYSRPNIMLTGLSGAGKTGCIRSLLEAGYRVAIGDSEGKIEDVQRFSPLVIPLGERANVGECIGLLADPKLRAEFVADSTQGKWDDIDIFAYDSLLEYEIMLDADLKKEHAGSSNKYERWDEYARKLITLSRLLRDLTHGGKVSKPIGVLATLGLVAEVTRLGERLERLPIKGNVAPGRLFFFYSYVLHMRSSMVDDEAHWYLDTVSTDAYQCKGPGTDVLPPTVDVTYGGPTTFGWCYRQLEQRFRGAATEDVK